MKKAGFVCSLLLVVALTVIAVLAPQPQPAEAQYGGEPGGYTYWATYHWYDPYGCALPAYNCQVYVFTYE